MANVWRITPILVLAHFVVSQTHNQCGEPTKYEGKQLDKIYVNRSEFSNNEKVAYICNPGYTQSEGSRITFCKDGHWKPLTMTCKKKTCSPLPDIKNGRYLQEGNSFLDKATAVCNAGYVLRGDQVRVCEDKGWTGMSPTCEEQNLKLWKCPRPKLGDKGIVKDQKSEYVTGESLSIKCNEGFNGSGDFTCVKNKKWIPREPKCHVVKCPAINILDGKVTTRKVVFGTVVQITCSPKFKLNGAQHLRCAANGSWTPAVPKCEPVSMVTCSAPAVANGDIHDGYRASYMPKDTVTITCKEGFDLIGSKDVICGPDGQWQALPECRLKEILDTSKCGPPQSTDLAHPREEYYGKEFKSGDRVRYKCTVGYRWSAGVSSIYCKDGQWTELQMQCELKKCGSAGEISYGRFEYTGVSFGDSAKAVCQDGYGLIGPAVRHCLDGGWNGRIPVCEPVHCPPPPVVKNADMFDPTDDYVPFGYALSYRCRTGNLIGERELHCTQNGTWSAPPPECKDVICPVPKVPNGSRMMGFRSVYRLGYTVMFTCSPGYKLKGENYVTCGQDGEWTPKLPQCV
ncbi:sushi, von Willebrand factor type A, EGF and pentraxin domain-containing protein 1 [Xyrauchen texanus]|uniref:sushi, von Willebrand factor type A, EGF and pentraxin domain-containing protein 1 n=1 Tax=Xyrauchen texanus TaxID=154827 RepID=UPI002241E631|nr:sushi, von Willebrand factor type A, EGF and pentraxin domain-containing protein 1 [Xyrauchen texanus]